MQIRTWPYGTTKRVTVLEFNRCNHEGKRCTVLAVTCGEDKEAYLLINSPEEPPQAKGTKGTITFTKGGPTGGYWKFQPDAKTQTS